MDIACAGMRDRRIAASDETVSVRGSASRIYRESSVAFAQGAQGARARGASPARFDRSPSAIRAIVLHQTAGSSFLTGVAARRMPRPSDDTRVASYSRIDRIAAHFVVLQDGTIMYTHDVQFVIDSAAGAPGIDIEVAGAFPSGASPDPARRLPVVAIRALRTLIRELKRQIPTITRIHPHGQVQTRDMVVGADGRRVSAACGGPGSANPCDKLVSCPGPDIWVNVGQWACRPAPAGLGLSSEPVAPHPNNGIVPALANAAYDQHVT